MNNVDKFVGQLSDIVQKIQDTVVTYAPDAAALALNVVRIDAAGQLLIGLALAAALYPTYRIGMWGYKLAKEAATFSNEEMVGGIAAMVSATGFCALTTFAALHLLNIWNWVALWHPELKLAKDIFDAATK